MEINTINTKHITTKPKDPYHIQIQYNQWGRKHCGLLTQKRLSLPKVMIKQGICHTGVQILFILTRGNSLSQLRPQLAINIQFDGRLLRHNC